MSYQPDSQDPDSGNLYENNKAKKLAFVADHDSVPVDNHTPFGVNPRSPGAVFSGYKHTQKKSLLQQLDELAMHNSLDLGGGKSSVGKIQGDFFGAKGRYTLQADKYVVVKNQKEIMKNLSKAAIRRMARRGGCKRISHRIPEEAREAAGSFLQKVLTESLTYTQHKKRSTVTAKDVVYALRRQGKPIYGLGN